MPTVSHHETTDACSAGALDVDRAITELRRGRFVRILDADQVFIVGAVETIESTRLEALHNQDQRSRLVLSAERGQVLGQSAQAQAWQIKISGDWPLVKLRNIAGLTWHPDPGSKDLIDSDRADAGADFAASMSGCDEPALTAGLELARLANLAPTLIVAAQAQWFDRASLLTVQASDIRHWSASRSNCLVRISDARVPLMGNEACRFILFRERFGGDEHVAITVGVPDTTKAVLVRLHSSCLTGDLFGSLRCDCGEQLRSSVEQLGREGGGMILYLAQEGRGIGLANKLRAYELQDRGLDTLDADRYLGFRHDERDYSVACAMLRELDVSQVRLMTNNPVKIAALRSGGIDVTDRSPLNTTVNPHNARYVQTKQERAGHFAQAVSPEANDSFEQPNP